MLPESRAPTHPGEILSEEFLKPLGITQTALAAKLQVPLQRVNTLIAGKRGVTPETAILLSKAFDTTPQFWMNLQTNYDLWHAAQAPVPNVIPFNLARAAPRATKPAKRAGGRSKRGARRKSARR